MSTEELSEVVRAALDAVPWEAERYSCADCESRAMSSPAVAEQIVTLFQLSTYL